MYLGHNGMPCPRRTSAGPSGTQSGFASGRGENLTDMGGLEEDEDIVGEDASDNDDWEDHPPEMAGMDGFGLLKLSGPDTFLVVDRSGIHPFRIHSCQCVGSPSEELQYLDLGLWPSTYKKIKTLFTFQVLDDFRMDNLECKTSALNYYNKLRRLSSPCFPHSVPVGVYLILVHYPS